MGWRRVAARASLSGVLLAGFLRVNAPLSAGEPGPDELHRQALEGLRRGETALASSLLERALTLQSPTADLLYDAAYVSYRRGKPEEARTLVQRCLRLAPDDPQALSLLGLLQLEAGQLTDAEGTLRSLLRRYPEHQLGLAYLGHCLALSGDMVAARRHLEKALGRDYTAPNGRTKPAERMGLSEADQRAAIAQAKASLGYVYLRLEEYGAAIACLGEALVLDALRSDTRFHLGLAQYSLGNTELALDAFAQVLKVDPDHRRARYHLALSLIKQGHKEQGLAELQKLASASETAPLARQCRELIEGGTLADEK